MKKLPKEENTLYPSVKKRKSPISKITQCLLLLLTSFFLTTGNAQNCTSGTIAKWSLSKESGDCSNDISASNGGFGVSSTNHQNCSVVDPSTVYRNQGGSSCVDGVDGNSDIGDAACTNSWTGNAWQDNSPYAVRFSLDLNTTQAGKISELSFYEKAPTYDSRWGNINYPTRYGIRILKNGVEVYQQINIPTTNSWSLETFDFANNSAFQYTGVTTYEVELMAYSPVGNGYTYYIWDLDDIRMKGCCGPPLCSNVTNPGEIGSDEAQCGDYNPANIISISPPSGGTGVVQYVWLKSTMGCPDGTTGSVIPGANGPTYDPGTITETTWYRRCARRAGCTNYVGESNCVLKEVLEGPEITSVLSFDPGCDNNDGSIFINIDGNTDDFDFNIGTGWFNTQNVFQNLAAGTYNIQVRNEDGTCAVSYSGNPVVLTAPDPTSCNAPPIAVDDNYSTMEDTPFSGDVSLNDSDPDNDPLTFTLLGDVSNGTLFFNNNGTFSYIPDANTSGPDSFSYEVSDGSGGTGQAVVFINVILTNDLPVAVDDTNSVEEDTPVSGTVAANDSDPDGDPLTFTQISNPANGQLIFNTDGSYTYTPGLNFNGTDFFTYEVNDGNGGTDQATVTIAVNPVNDPPIARDDFETGEQDIAISASVEGNDEDPDGDPLTFTLISTASNGTLNFVNNGSYTYIPFSGYVGTDTFLYQISDGNGGTDQAVVTITLTSCSPPNAVINQIPIICAEEPVVISAQDAGAGATYLWDFGAGATPGTSTNLSETVVFATEGTKSVSLVVTQNNCSATVFSTVTVTPAVTADGGADKSICLGDAVQVGGIPSGPAGASFLWAPSTGLNSQTVANPVASPAVTTTYTLFVTIAGCTRTSQVTVNVAVMVCKDTDMDGKPDIIDIDDDNDGIPDLVEGNGSDPSADDNGDDIPNYQDPTYPGFTDANNDGVNDVFDKDNDGIPNHIDLDSDNDSVPDLVEAGNGDKDNNGDGTLGSGDTGGGDSDGDGLVDSLDPDNTGVPLADPKNSDNDSTPDYIDLDADNDGVADVNEAGKGELDTNKDGIINSEDFNGGDNDGDGIPNSNDDKNGFAATPNSQNGQPDTDKDGVIDLQDLDADNDGTTDVVEGGNSSLDTNNDGTVDANDTNGGDSDNDGIPDAIDQFVGVGNAVGTQGPAPDTDQDGIPDLKDLDADNDGIVDILETNNGDNDSNQNGYIGAGDIGGGDSDGDGIPDVVDNQQGPGAGANNQPPAQDSDNDNIPDFADLDSDNDGVADVVEGGLGMADSNDDGVIDQTDFDGTDLDKDGMPDSIDDSFLFGGPPGSQTPASDKDGDNVPDFLDLDSDNDGTTDIVESGNGNADTNGNGILDQADTNGGDDDNDGIPNSLDEVFGAGTANGAQGEPKDTDSDGVPDLLDIDGDNDGITDVIEAGKQDLDTNQDGLIDSNDQNGADADLDGIADANDTNPEYGAGNNSQADQPDTDGDQIPDYLDVDSDNDALSDAIEAGNEIADTNNDGVIDKDDINGFDSDGDGLANAVDGKNGNGALVGSQQPAADTDGDLVPDFRDLDSDNDGLSDVIEGDNEMADTNRDGLINENDANGEDFDQDGLANAVDNQLGIGGSPGSQHDAEDFDGDGLGNFIDLDSDNDAIADIVEAGLTGFDTNKDGIISTLDANGGDTDGDGLANALDQNAGMGANIGALLNGPDTDNDNVIDALDLDSDNDGIADIYEAGKGNFDTNNNGVLTSADVNGADTDNDGLANAIDSNTGRGGAANSQANQLDTDGDNLPDFVDIDSDNDGITDIVESGNLSFDTNKDGILSILDTNGADQDADGLVNAIDFNVLVGGAANSQGNMIDTDGDLAPDFLDLDADNDGIADVIEAGYADFDTDKNACLNSNDNNGGDTDLDGYFNALDAFIGIGAAPNSQGVERNTDGDTRANHIDLDSDNDGITDLHESGRGILDTNGDGAFTIADNDGQDTDNDGLVNAIDGFAGYADVVNGQAFILDTDSDLAPNFIDLDSDNDGLGDLAENGGNALDTDKNGSISTIDANGADADNDGIPNAIDGANGYGVAINGQGNFLDTDGDTAPNYLDIDSDNDAIADVIEGAQAAADINFDGIIDLTDINGDDSDFDGIPNVIDGYFGFGFVQNYHLVILNTDNDGVFDYLDLDSDNDGISDLAEGGNYSFDTNGDGILNLNDTGGADTDQDGLADIVDGSAGFADAANGQIAKLTDGDGLFDFQDLDSDNDGISDLHESYYFLFDTNLNGILDAADDSGGDSDNDGFSDILDTFTGYGLGPNGIGGFLDTDFDLVFDYVDLDADNDGLGDVLEAGFIAFDTNRDGTIDQEDNNGGDSDADGLTNTVDFLNGFGAGNNSQGNIRDTDSDGIRDFLDLDTDNDGITDIFESGNRDNDSNLNGYFDLNDANGADLDGDGLANAIDGNPEFADLVNGQPNAPDLDGDLVANHRDLDTDNDGITDVIEAGYANGDTNQNGTADATEFGGADRDSDGVADTFDDFEGFGYDNNGQAGILDTDGDFAFNFQDLDSDNDGLADLVENGNFSFDTNRNGTIGLSESSDADGDGLMAAVDGFSGFGGTIFTLFAWNFGTDNIPNYIDLDSDNDGISDLTEAWGDLSITIAYDTSNDGKLDGTDADGDGLLDIIDQFVGFANANNAGLIPDDSDTDGFFSFLDIDADNDGILDNSEAQPTLNYLPLFSFDLDSDGIDDAYDQNTGIFGGFRIIVMDTDSDGIPDYLDDNSDGDTETDIIEGNDFDGDGVADVLPGGGDVDGDGLLDNFDQNIGSKDATDGGKTPLSYPNANGYQEQDWRIVLVCVDVEIKVLLEGGLFDKDNQMNFLPEMRADLNLERSILPGQTPTNPLVLPTPAGQPYSESPWGYPGTEGASWTDANYESVFAAYGSQVVDWVLVSFRKDIEQFTEVGKTGALVLQDGRVVFVDECALTNEAGPLYIVVEHRNHLGIMTTQPVDITNGNIFYDFTLTNTYKGEGPNPAGFGQKLLPDGRYAMYGGDNDQETDVISYDINAMDKILWTEENGNFDQYRLSDLDLNGDVNGADKILWNINNGVSSRVLK